MLVSWLIWILHGDSMDFMEDQRNIINMNLGVIWGIYIPKIPCRGYAYGIIMKFWISMRSKAKFQGHSGLWRSLGQHWHSVVWVILAFRGTFLRGGMGDLVMILYKKGWIVFVLLLNGEICSHKLKWNTSKLLIRTTTQFCSQLKWLAQWLEERRFQRDLKKNGPPTQSVN